jgi:glycosyltransferase involved in cell wall biosynthesis
MLPEELAKIPGVRIRVVPTDPVLIGARRFKAFRTVMSHPWIVLAFFNMVGCYARLIREENIDIILTSSIKSDYYGSLVGALARCSVVWYVHDIVDAHYFPKWARDSLVLFANLFAAKILCNSDATRLALMCAGVNEKKLLTVYYPPIDQVEIANASDVDIRSEMDVPSSTRLVTIVGRITFTKGQLEFVRAAGEVMLKQKDVLFLIVGDSVFGAYDDDYKQQVVQAIEQLSEPRRVRMLGMRPDVLRIISESDVIVFHSLWPEGFGLAVAEAMQLGRPVVATPLGGTSEMIEDGVTGLRVEPGDVTGLSSAICRLLDNREEVDRLGQAGQQRIRQMLSPGNVRQLQLALENVVRIR